MHFESYKQFWNNQAQTPEAALAAVDGSTDEAIVRRTGRFAAAQMRAALDIQAGDRVLELGCGVGRIGKELAADCAHWTGVDISEQMISHAQERMAALDNVDFYQLQRSSLEMIPDTSIDKAYSLAVLCHMDKEDLFLYLEELHRILTPGGLIYLDTWNLAHPIGWKRWQYEVRFWQRSDQIQRKDIARNQFCTPDELKLYAEKAGFELLDCFDDSHWLQLIAGKELPDRALQEQRLLGQREHIAYSPLFVQLFEKTLEVIYGETHPRDALAFLDQHTNTTEGELFRPFIRGLWENNRAHWGEVES
jgi:ubiquinone/menaquinone biosynthesis C-methylase UbiE